MRNIATYDWEYLDAYSFDNLMTRCLARVSNDIDKRQGSIIYDAIAPATAELAQAYVNLQLFYINNHLLTASGNSLDYRCADFGITRIGSTYAERVATCLDQDGNPYNILVGSRYSTIATENPLFYKCIAKLTDGSFVLQCETIGTIGNQYIGDLLPVEYTARLGSIKISTIYKPARDTETDNEFRNRTLEWLRNKPFGGNVAHYRQWCSEYDGIGQVQVYPTWAGGGTVKLVIVDPLNQLCSLEFIEQVKEYFDPEPYGNGLGQAPIGHTVTVETATEKQIDVEFTSTLSEGVTPESIKPAVTAALESYIDELRAIWGTSDSLNQYNLAVYRAKIINALFNVTGILNVTDVKINNIESDLVLTEDKNLQEMPILGTVTIHAA
ncbi:baseplate J/gp47 family protein [Anaerosinus massiliensis]|uniref:baseplate J/gp47 family protein n=1 Tax=Massilibacillus massiliensis TaxID=1806837 RepID=UPI000A5C2CE4|nr:baseplate J/gp47 family protein [Massilibacillus massiliensis]